MRAAREFEAVAVVAGTGDTFLLHPSGRPDVRLSLTGRELLRLRAVLDDVAQRSGRAELSEAARTIAGKLDGYFAGLR
jgi:hypothetical protein